MSEFNWSALILAGGRGSRMETAEPKPLVRVGDITLLERNVTQAWRAGADKVFVALHHRSAEIMESLTKQLGGSVDLRFVIEPEPLGTIGALGKLVDAAPVVLTANGDLLSAIDLQLLVERYRKSGADGFIATHIEHHQLKLGEVESDADDRLVAYIEKPIKEYRISSGTNVFGPRVIELVNGRTRLGVPELIQQSLEIGLDLRVYPQDYAWIDVNDLEDLANAGELLNEFSVQFRHKPDSQ